MASVTSSESTCDLTVNLAPSDAQNRSSRGTSGSGGPGTISGKSHKSANPTVPYAASGDAAGEDDFKGALTQGDGGRVYR